MLRLKIIGKILSALLLVGILILLGYVAWVYLLPRWVAILFYTYWILGIINWSLGITAAIQSRAKSQDWAQKLSQSIAKIFQPQSVGARFNRLRDAISTIASTLASVILWPIDFIYGLSMSLRHPGEALNVEEIGLKKIGGLPEFIYSFLALASVLAILGLGFLRVNLKVYGTITLALMVASASLRHLSYTVGTVSLPARLRRFGANPYAMFLIVIAVDFSILVMGLTALSLPGKLDTITWQALIKTGHELLQSEGALKGILKGARPTVHELVVAFVGLLFSLALLKVLTQFGEFKRKDADYVWLAAIANRLGNFSTALRHLRNVKSWDTQARSVEMVALLGVNEVDKAAQKVQLLLEGEHHDTSDTRVFAEMVQACLMPHIPPSVYMAILKRGIDLNVLDAVMQDCVGLVLRNKLYQEAIALFSPVADRFPLSTARIYILADDSKAGIAILEAHPPVPDLDQLIGLVLTFTAYTFEEATTDDENVQNFATCASQAIPLIRKLNSKRGEQREQLTTFQEIQRLLTFAQKYGRDKVEELKFLADSIKDELRDEDSTKKLATIESQYQ